MAARFLPYWIEPLNLNPCDRRNPIRILANRWVFVNETIDRYAEQGHYMLLKFEDLFNQNETIASDSISAVADFLKIKIRDHNRTADLLRNKMNESPKKYNSSDLTSIDEAYIQKTCGELKIKYRYD